jgi:hypothetical protein
VLNAIDKTRKLVSENISKAQAEYKHYHDKTIKATPPSYVPGSRVWLFKPWLRKGLHHKCHSQWDGPYYVTIKRANGTYFIRSCVDDRELGPINYRRLTKYNDPSLRPPELVTAPPLLAIPETNENGRDSTQPSHPGDTQPIIVQSNDNQSQLDETDDQTDDQTTPQSQILPSDQYIVEKITGTRTQGRKRQYRVKWRDYSEPSWVDRDDIHPDLITDYNILKSKYKKRK